MSDINELYQEVIIDHGRRPRNHRRIDNPTDAKQGYNPLCGDSLTLYLQVEAGIIKDISFEGQGCAISMASTSMMTEALLGKTIAEAQQLFTDFHDMILSPQDAGVESLGKLSVLSGVTQYPMRVKCATLAWHTFKAIMDNDDTTVSTEK
jgi:nitrogen fixation protein NifU and related proteins